MLHHMGNAWVSSSIFHSTGKCNKTHRMGRTWEIGEKYSYFSGSMDAVFPVDSHFMVCSSHGKGKCFLINFPKHGKRQPHSPNGESLGNWFPLKFYKNHCMWRTWEIGTHTFSIVWVLFSIRFSSYGILHRMENAWVFLSHFP